MTINEVYKRCKAEFKEKERGSWIASKILLVVALVHLTIAIIFLVNIVNSAQMITAQNFIFVPINLTLWAIGLELGNKPDKAAAELIKEGKHESIPSDYPYSLVYTGMPYPFDRTDLPPAKDYVPTVAEPVAPAPVAVEPVPVAVEPVPAAVEPVPVAVEPTPVAVEPVPVAVEPVPVAVELVPVAVEPVPVAVEPVPVAVAPAEPSYLERLSGIAPVAPIPAEEKPAPIARPQNASTKKAKYCHACGWDMADDQDICENCGKKYNMATYLERLSSMAPVAPIPAEEKPAPIARPAQKTNTKKAKYCRHCGWDMDYDQEICENCGKEYNGPYVYAEQEKTSDEQSYLQRLSNIAPVAPIPVEEKSIPAPAAVNTVPVAPASAAPVFVAPTLVAPAPVAAPTPAAAQPELETLFCQQCGNQMMIPRNSGTVKITCIKCGYGFIHTN